MSKAIRKITIHIEDDQSQQLINLVQDTFSTTEIIENKLLVPYPTKRVFVSYRRADSEDFTGRIYDRLIDFFHHNHVFKDTQNIPLGYDFRITLKDEVESCDAFLAIIGQKWDVGDIGKRLFEMDDYVRFEIATALGRSHPIPIIPVLVQHRTEMPTADALPPDLQNLLFRQKVTVRPDPDFEQDMQRLIEALETEFASL